MSRVLTALAVVAVLGANAAQGQVIRRPSTGGGPAAYTLMGVGLLRTGTVVDGSTGSSWDFGDGVQYRVSLEKAIQNQSSVGVALTFGRLPLIYTSNVDLQCSSCDADATITQLMGTFHVGGDSPGIHQVIDIDVGATMYSAFRERATGRKLSPSSDTDLAFSIGGGVGYTLSPGFQIELVQQFGGSVHQRTGLSGNADTIVRSYVTRLGVRFGLGARR